jgi:hypothetical protein
LALGIDCITYWGSGFRPKSIVFDGLTRCRRWAGDWAAISERWSE